MEMTEFLLLFGSMSGLLHVSTCLQFVGSLSDWAINSF